MKRILLAAALIAIGGAAHAARADDAKPARSAYVSGRNVVWTAPRTETPYALQGQESRTPAEKPRLEVVPHGRAGTTYDWNAQSGK